jgi:P pilus assembly chaperone PapD
MKGSVRQALAAAVIVALGAAGSANAMTVTPVHVEMKSVGNAARSQITVTNPGKTPLPVETFLERLQLTESSERRMTRAGKEFLVFPPQAMIPAGGTQVFRLQWVGEPNLAKSESYLFQVSQVPVKMPAGQSKVQVVMSFGVVVNVGTPQGVPSLKVIGTSITTDKQGKRRAVVTLENPTSTHALLPQGKLVVAGNGWSHSLTQTEIREKIGIGLVQPGKRRKFTLPMDVPARVTTVQAKLDFNPKR